MIRIGHYGIVWWVGRRETQEDLQNLQEDISLLSVREDTWLMEFTIANVSYT